jgi:2-aminoadipate transaminase
MADTVTNPLAELYSERARRFGERGMSNPRDSAALISFFAGFPDPGSLPRNDVAEATRVALERDGEWALQYGASSGDPELVRELLAKLKRDQGIQAGGENVIITNGASQALALIVDMLVNPGDVVLSEAPTWMGAVRAFDAAGAETHEIPVNDGGLDIDTLEQELNTLSETGRRAKFLYLIPNFQNPTGFTTTLERRKKIVQLAQTHNLPIIEDDAYFDLRYAGDTLPTLYTLDDSGLVMYMGTFSKIMAAGMRLGWTIANPAVIRQMTGLKSEGGTSPFASHVAAEFASSGTLTEHVHELRTLYHSRRDAMLKALEVSMPAGTTWTTPEGGFFIWVTLPDGVSVRELAPASKDKGVEICPGFIFYFHGKGDNQIRLSYSFADEPNIQKGIKILGDLVKEQLTT